MRILELTPRSGALHAICTGIPYHFVNRVVTMANMYLGRNSYTPLIRLIAQLENQGHITVTVDSYSRGQRERGDSTRVPIRGYLGVCICGASSNLRKREEVPIRGESEA